METSETIPSPHDTRNDFIAGWLGGAVGILVSNPFEVLKVRLQTTRVPSGRVGGGSRTPSPPTPLVQKLPEVVQKAVAPVIEKFTANPPPLRSSSTPSSSAAPRLPPHVPTISSAPPLPPVPSTSTSAASTTAKAIVQAVSHKPPTLVQLYRAEGLKFLFAGAAGPIMGLAIIDSAFFAGYGRGMQVFHQDRANPDRLSAVFLAGAASGGACALLQTPIEVVKTRAQAESLSAVKQTKKGSFKIAAAIYGREGIRGFYTGGLMTACRDSISSGMFFWGYFVFRRLLRGEKAFEPSPSIPKSSSHHRPPRPEALEICRMLLAGGLAGSLSAVVPYPIDIIKTRLQTSRPPLPPPQPHTLTPPLPAPSIPPPKRPTARHVAYEIYQDGKLLPSSTYPWFPKSWRGFRGFLTGLRPTVICSFVGSGVTITVFELALIALGEQEPELAMD